MVCVSRSCSRRGSLAHSCTYQLFSDRKKTCSVSPKVDTEIDQAPTCQASPRDTDHVRPSNLAARNLLSVEHTPSKFGHGPCPVRRGRVAAVKCCARKERFLCCPAGQVIEQEQEIKKSEPQALWASAPQRWNTI